MQNNIEELWSLLNFLSEDDFDDREGFLEDFGAMKDQKTLTQLQRVLQPFVLRRMKNSVTLDLKPLEELIVHIELTRLQKTYYRAIFEKNVSFLTGSSKLNERNISLMNVAMQLRKCCNHPYLLDDGIEAEVLEQQPEYAAAQDEDVAKKIVTRQLVRASGKMDFVDKLLLRLREEGRKVLIFSQMVRVLDILEDYCSAQRYAFERIDGGVSSVARQEAIDRFSDPQSDSFVFLLCTRAGGMGINLTAADTVIIFDSDWNPQNDLQVDMCLFRACAASQWRALFP